MFSDGYVCEQFYAPRVGLRSWAPLASRTNTIQSGHWCARCHFIAITTNPRAQREQRHKAARN